jgi:2-keto-4-pentenoate hydratase
LRKFQKRACGQIEHVSESSQHDDFDFDLLAERMLRDYDNRTPGTLFADGLRLSLVEARRLQDEVAQIRQRRGEQVTGYKIGSVSPINQRRNGLPHPVWGRLWSTEQHTDGVRLEKADFANLAIEGEFAIMLGRDVNSGEASLQTIIESVERVFPVIELHNLVFRGADPKGSELIANNAIHSGVVRGDGCVRPSASVVTDLSVQFDGKIVEQWRDIKWPNDILAAVAWLTDNLAQSGLSLRRGQMILTGALGPPLSVADISEVKVSSSQFGTVEMQLV